MPLTGDAVEVNDIVCPINVIFTKINKAISKITFFIWFGLSIAIRKSFSIYEECF